MLFVFVFRNRNIDDKVKKGWDYTYWPFQLARPRCPPPPGIPRGPRGKFLDAPGGGFLEQIFGTNFWTPHFGYYCVKMCENKLWTLFSLQDTCVLRPSVRAAPPGGGGEARVAPFDQLD